MIGFRRAQDEFEAHQSAVFRELDGFFGRQIAAGRVTQTTINGLAECRVYVSRLPRSPLREAYEFWLPQFERDARNAKLSS